MDKDKREDTTIKTKEDKEPTKATMVVNKLAPRNFSSHRMLIKAAIRFTRLLLDLHLAKMGL